MYIPKGGVAFFDSGIGGLTVLAECKKRLPFHTFYYYGDNARAPYGNLKTSVIQSYVFEIFEKLASLQPSAAVIACNTATALCIDELRKMYAFPIIGAEPAVFSAVKRGGEIFVLATRATCESMRFQNLCKKASQIFTGASIHSFACERLAGEIENNLFDKQNKNFDFSPFLPKGNPDAVVLGCTHYVFIKEQIHNFYQCPTFDGNAGMANRLCSFVDNFPNPLYGLNCGELNLGRWKSERERDGQPLFTTTQETPFYAPVYFLGEQKALNERIFEQMFAKISK